MNDFPDMNIVYDVPYNINVWSIEVIRVEAFKLALAYISDSALSEVIKTAESIEAYILYGNKNKE